MRYVRHSSFVTHVQTEKHRYLLNRETVSDVALKLYKARMEGIRVTATAAAKCSTASKERKYPLQVGWAMSSERKHSRFNENQIDFLTTLFQEGEKTGQKWRPKDVSTRMRSETLPTGNLRFTRAEFLSEQQIISYFSRLSAKKNLRLPADTPDDEADELAMVAKQDKRRKKTADVSIRSARN